MLLEACINITDHISIVSVITIGVLDYPVMITHCQYAVFHENKSMAMVTLALPFYFCDSCHNKKFLLFK